MNKTKQQTNHSYVPPHKRTDTKENTTENKPKDNSKYKREKLDIHSVTQFPEMNSIIKPKITTNPTIITDKPTLSSIFKKSLLPKKKIVKAKLKKGWIHLTKNGIIDSLTPTERKEEDEAYEQRIYQINLHRMCVENERKLQYRRENDHTYLWEELDIIDEFEDIDIEDESDYDSYDDYSQTDDEYYDNYNKNKDLW
jgi:hypothetical protein